MKYSNCLGYYKYVNKILKKKIEFKSIFNFFFSCLFVEFISQNMHQTKIKVRYGETDQMGVVYHGNYAHYLEIGRLEWLDAIGVSYRQMEANGVMLPVVSMSLKYYKSAVYGDTITISTTLLKRPTASIEFNYKIHNSSGKLLTTAHTKLAFVDMKSNFPMRCPQYILDQLQI